MNQGNIVKLLCVIGAVFGVIGMMYSFLLVGKLSDKLYLALPGFFLIAPAILFLVYKAFAKGPTK